MWGMYGAILAKRRAEAKRLVTEVVGKTLNEALAELKTAGLEVQLLEVDGTTLAPASDFKPERLGLVVSKGLVTGAQIG